MPQTAVLNVTPEIKAGIELLANELHRHADEVVAEALESYMQAMRDYDHVLQARVAIADAGKFASDEEVETFFAKHADSE